MAKAFSYKKIKGSDDFLPLPRHPDILPRIIDRDETAINDCLAEYCNFIWALAKKLTSSTQDAEVATREIFLDIWRQIGSFDPARCSEKDFIFAVAYRILTDRT